MSAHFDIDPTVPLPGGTSKPVSEVRGMLAAVILDANRANTASEREELLSLADWLERVMVGE